MKLPGIFTKALEETLLGWLVFSFVIPAFALWSGISGLIHGEINVRGADVSGLSARLYAAGFISVGVGMLAQSRHNDGGSSFHAVRLLAGVSLGLLFIIAGTICLFI
ncbi:hypothetical protein [Haloferula sp.]|uniref:hypothetical protein n=1 Tax=Haloferula sp. TaxID=2497595 RepID=UPI0032A0E450